MLSTFRSRLKALPEHAEGAPSLAAAAYSRGGIVKRGGVISAHTTRTIYLA